MSKNTFFRLLRQKGVRSKLSGSYQTSKWCVSCLFIAAILQSGFILLDLARRSTSPSTEASLGLTGLEPVTLRLSSACSNQLSYRPGIKSQRVRIRPGRWR